jgi:hypothetical protein
MLIACFRGLAKTLMATLEEQAKIHGQTLLVSLRHI